MSILPCPKLVLIRSGLVGSSHTVTRLQACSQARGHRIEASPAYLWKVNYQKLVCTCVYSNWFAS